MFAAKNLLQKNIASMTLRPSSVACFSSAAASKESLFDEIINSAEGISDYNFKSYFVRRANEDKAKMDSFTVEELEERLE